MNELLIVNPRRRKRRRKASGRVSRRVKNPRRRVSGFRSRRRRNPRFGGSKLSVGGIVKQLIPAATGAVGAVGLDVALAYIPIPDSYKTGWLGTGVKILGAVGLGMIAGKVVGRERGHLFTAGALTVIAYQVVRNLASQSLGDKVKGLSGYEDFTDLALPGSNVGSPAGMGAYMRPALAGPGLGAYMNPAGVLNGMGELDGGNSGGGDYYG